MSEWEKVKKSDEDRAVEELVSFVDSFDGCGLVIEDLGMVAESVAECVRFHGLRLAATDE